jgi:hypothetical protein
VYNLKVDPSKPSNYKVKYSIVNLNGTEVATSDWRSKKKPGESAVEIITLVLPIYRAACTILKLRLLTNQTSKAPWELKGFIF